MAIFQLILSVRCPALFTVSLWKGWDPGSVRCIIRFDLDR